MAAEGPSQMTHTYPTYVGCLTPRSGRNFRTLGSAGLVPAGVLQELGARPWAGAQQSLRHRGEQGKRRGDVPQLPNRVTYAVKTETCGSRSQFLGLRVLSHTHLPSAGGLWRRSFPGCAQPEAAVQPVPPPQEWPPCTKRCSRGTWTASSSW